MAENTLSRLKQAIPEGDAEKSDPLTKGTIGSVVQANSIFIME